MLDVKSGTFWRQLGTYVVGGLFVGLPLFVPALAPLAPYLIPAGATMLGLAGTRVAGQAAPATPSAPPAKRSTPSSGNPPPAA